MAGPFFVSAPCFRTVTIDLPDHRRSTMTQAVFLDLDSLTRDDIDLAPLEAAVPGWRLHAQTRPQEVLARVRDARIVVSNKVVLDAATLARARSLQLICVAATGTNNVDLAAAAEHGITVCNVRDYGTPSVAEHVFALMLSLRRRLLDYRLALGRGEWQRSSQFCLLDYPMAELQGATLGIVGHGVLGQAVARLGEAFGMRVRVAERPAETPRPGRVPLDDLLAEADVLSLHCPLTETTRNLIDAAALARMKPGALLINTARGGIVDETALLDALRSGHLGGAGIDVLATEPPTGPHPLLEADLPQLIVTPHVAWASREARQRLLDQIADNIRAFRAGTPRNVVTAAD